MMASSRQSHRGGESGYTLVEMLVVCAISAVLLGLAIPRYGAAREAIELRNTANQFLTDVRLAQEIAQKEWTWTRLVFFEGYYLLQVAVDQAPTPSCDTGRFETVKRAEFPGVSLDRQNWPSECLLFERTGRGSWPNPVVERTSTDSDMSNQALFSYLLDGYRMTGVKADLAETDPALDPVVWWDAVQEVDLFLDMGTSRSLDSVCVGIIRYLTYGTEQDWPTAELSVRTAAASSQWQTVGRLNLPASGAGARGCLYLDMNSWFQANPAWAEQVRYLWIRIEGDGGLAIDEIEIAPTVRFTSSSGRLTKTATISSATGSVTLSNN